MGGPLRRGRWHGVVAALGLAVIGAVVTVAPARGVDGRDPVDGEEFVAQPPIPLDARERALVRQRLDEAKRAKPADAPRLWRVAAATALERAASLAEPPGIDDPDVVKALREACKHLTARELAMIASQGRHPEISLAFCRALDRQAPRGVAAGLERAAEARDALAHFGPVRGKPFLGLAGEPGTPAPAAGGAQNSVFAVTILLTSSETFPFVHGFSAGLREAWPDTGGSFRIRHVYVREQEAWTAAGVARAIGYHPGLLVVAEGSMLLSAAAGMGRDAGIPVLDARGHSALDHESWGADFAKRVSLASGRDSSYFPAPLPWDDHLRSTASGGVFDPARDLLRTFVLRPPGTERARRLGEVLLARRPTGDVAIAVPEEGGDQALVRGFEFAAAALGRRVHLLRYAPGRRDFAPEARRFTETGAVALLLAGPAEESSEWLVALARAGQRPLLLGSSELEPAGFHPAARAGLEGACFVGDDWESRSAAYARSAGAGAEVPESRRGHRAGWLLACAVKGGAFTPASLALALRERSLSVRSADPWEPSYIARLEDGPRGAPGDLAVPLFEVRSGEAVPLPGF